MPRGCLYIYQNCAVQPIEYPYSIDFVRHIGTLYTIGVGLRRCSFRQDGQFPGASERGASDCAGLHAFFMSYSGYYWKTWVGGALNPINGLGIIKNG